MTYASVMSSYIRKLGLWGAGRGFCWVFSGDCFVQTLEPCLPQLWTCVTQPFLWLSQPHTHTHVHAHTHRELFSMNEASLLWMYNHFHRGSWTENRDWLHKNSTNRYTHIKILHILHLNTNTHTHTHTGISRIRPHTLARAHTHAHSRARRRLDRRLALLKWRAATKTSTSTSMNHLFYTTNPPFTPDLAALSFIGTF